MISEDLIKIKAEFDKDTVIFLRYLNDNYIPAEKKIELTDEMLKENQLKRTIITKFCPIFHPDKNVNEEKKIQVLRQEITKFLTRKIEYFKGQ